ncbi:LysR family transcriptional regulator [Klebsiella pneumoniae subsp. pneumoniae]|nr:LysR family transcriptional regulator [Klebsiella pneumoniae subsp. pneumoniae]
MKLCVTPSAVSQQIARLEETLNVPLFIRTPRRLQLTAVGRDLPAGRSAGVSSDSRRHPAPAGAPGPEKVAISCTSGFAIQGAAAAG